MHFPCWLQHSVVVPTHVPQPQLLIWPHQMTDVAHHCSCLQWLCLTHVIVATEGNQNRLAVIAAHNDVDCASKQHHLQFNMATSMHKHNMETTNLAQNTQIWQIGAPSGMSKSDRLECMAIGQQTRPMETLPVQATKSRTTGWN